MRDAVHRLLGEGHSQAEIARRLGRTKGAVAYHARRLGLPVDTRFARRYDWARVQEAHDAGLGCLACCERFGFSPASWSQAVARGDLTPRARESPISQLLTVGPKRSRSHLKRRLIAEGLKHDRCEICRLSDWQGREIALQVHHVNGDPRDNRLENIQLLCPNCHSQTDNWGKRNAARPDPIPCDSALPNG